MKPRVTKPRCAWWKGSLRGSGYTVARNDPFKGVEIIRASGQPARGWQSLQIEVRRSLYMDAQLQKNEGYPRLQKAVDRMLADLAAYSAGLPVTRRRLS